MAGGAASVPLPQLVGDQACTHMSKTASMPCPLGQGDPLLDQERLKKLFQFFHQTSRAPKRPSFLLLSRCLRISQAFSKVLQVQTIETTTHSLVARGPLLPLLFYQLWSLCLTPRGYSEVTPTKARSQRGHPVLQGLGLHLSTAIHGIRSIMAN